ncbi:MAG: hypothetical protein QGI50_13200 [Dehalococcoidia bacterium]|jgi:hypothetical protein|nr:hypothetical protein [Dehalococcoidia bacterium]
MDLIALGSVLAAAVAALGTFTYLMRGITFEGMGTDQQAHVEAAAEVRRWRWPSDMHKFAKHKARMKDVGLLMIVLMQLLFRDRKSFYPLSVGCLLANSIAAVLVFLVASTYWNTGIGLLLFVLYLTCLWPYMVVLNGAFQGLAVMFLLLSIYFLQLATATGTVQNAAGYGAAGLAFGLMLFSSASSRKLVPLFLAAFLVSLRDTVGSLGFGLFRPESGADWSILVIGSAVFGALLVSLAASQIYGSISGSRVHGWAVSLLSRRSGKSEEVLGQYLAKFAARHAPRLIFLALSAVAFVTASSLFFGSRIFYISSLAAVGGLGLAVLALVFPRVLERLVDYYRYYIQVQYFGHYELYDEVWEQRFGKTLREGTGGALWFFRYARRMIPFHAAFYVAGVLYLVYIAVFGVSFTEGAGTLTLILLSASPILWSQFTKCPKANLPYSPTFIGLFLVFGHAAFTAQQALSSANQVWFWLAVFSMAAAAAVWNAWFLLRDVLPARMAIARLGKQLRELNIEGFYTYKTTFNAAFVEALPDLERGRYKIQYIDTLADIEEGYVAVPGTSAKAMNMEGSAWAIKYGDFDEDPELTRLIESKEIERYAVASFETFGTSQRWVQQYDVPSFRDLILQEIGEGDRYRGRAWILDAGKLRADRDGA